jgi:hypothetical protein
MNLMRFLMRFMVPSMSLGWGGSTATLSTVGAGGEVGLSYRDHLSEKVAK